MPLPIAPNASLPALEFDVGEEACLRGGKRVWTGSDGRRGLELLVLLALAHEEGRAQTDAELARGTAGPLPPAQARRILRVAEARGLVVGNEDGRWQLVLAEGVPLRPAPAVLRAWLTRLQLRLVRDGRHAVESMPEARVVLAEALQGMIAGNAYEAMHTLTRYRNGSSGLSWIERSSSGEERVKLTVEALALATELSMQLGEIAEAEQFLRRATRWAERLKEPDVWLTRLCQHEGSAFRMEAALHPGRSREALSRSVRAFARAGDIVARSRIFSDEERRARSRWAFAEGTTSSLLLGDVSLSKEWIGKAEAELGKFASDGSEGPSTTLKRIRIELTAGDVAAARRSLDEVAREFRDHTAPLWVRGWFPRYEADLAKIEGAPQPVLRDILRRAWELNQGLGFYRLHILARFALWGVEPTERGDVENTFGREVSVLTSRWHARLRGTPPSRCLVCREADPARGRSILPRIRCAFTIPGRGLDGPAGLGVWL